MLGEDYDPHVAAKLRHDLGLDKPVMVQYFVWLGRVFRGDLGKSIYSEDPVSTLLLEKAKTTVPLALGSMIVGVLIAIPIGVLAAIYRNSLFDHISRILAMIGASKYFPQGGQWPSMA